MNMINHLYIITCGGDYNIISDSITLVFAIELRFLSLVVSGLLKGLYVFRIVFSAFTVIVGLILMFIGASSNGDDEDKFKKKDLKNKAVNIAVRTLYLSFGAFVTGFGVVLVLTDIFGKETINEYLSYIDKLINNEDE